MMRRGMLNFSGAGGVGCASPKDEALHLLNDTLLPGGLAVTATRLGGDGDAPMIAVAAIAGEQRIVVLLTPDDAALFARAFAEARRDPCLGLDRLQ